MTVAHVFNPTAWLASFEKAGGAYVLTGDHLFLWIFPGDLAASELTIARGMVAELRSADRAQIIEHLRCPALMVA